MNVAICGAVSIPRPQGSLFTVLDDLERAASRLPATAEFSAQVANRYLGPPADVGCCKEQHPKEPDDANVARRLVALARRIDDAASAIDYNLNRLSE